MTRYIGLLRGINVGGRRSLKMADLRALVVEAGGEDVATYIQSGNIVFSHPDTSPRELADVLAQRIEVASGMAVPVVLRTAEAWDRVVEANPYPDAGSKELHVFFLGEPVPPETFDAVDLDKHAPDDFVAAGSELYLHLPNGMGRAKLPVELERAALKSTTVTARNWATVLKLREMAHEA